MAAGVVGRTGCVGGVAAGVEGRSAGVDGVVARVDGVIAGVWGTGRTGASLAGVEGNGGCDGRGSDGASGLLAALGSAPEVGSGLGAGSGLDGASCEEGEVSGRIGAGVTGCVLGGVAAPSDGRGWSAAPVSGCAQFEHQRASARLAVPQFGQR
jgi:hypothetical protein